MLEQKPIRDDKWKIWFYISFLQQLVLQQEYLSRTESILSQMKDWGERARGGEIPERLERAETSEDEEMSSVITLASTGHK